MSKGFTDNEKKIIKEALIKEAINCIKIYGIKKTTVDELTKRCNIAKGSFYNFYDSKEMLFFDAIMKWHNQITEEFIYMIKSCEEINVDSITEKIFNCYKKCFEIGLGNILVNGEIEYLIRKLPPEIVNKHFTDDEDIISELVKQLPNSNKIDTNLYSSAFRGVFLLLMYSSEIGERFDDVLRLTIKGIVIQMLGGVCND